MNKHPYYQLIAMLRKQRNFIIGDFRSFKRNRVNRGWLSHSAFSLTVNKFRKEIAWYDKYIAGGKLALRVSKETGVMHYFDYDSNSVYSKEQNIKIRSK